MGMHIRSFLQCSVSFSSSKCVNMFFAPRLFCVLTLGFRNDPISVQPFTGLSGVRCVDLCNCANAFDLPFLLLDGVPY